MSSTFFESVIFTPQHHEFIFSNNYCNVAASHATFPYGEKYWFRIVNLIFKFCPGEPDLKLIVYSPELAPLLRFLERFVPSIQLNVLAVSINVKFVIRCVSASVRLCD